MDKKENIDLEAESEGKKLWNEVQKTITEAAGEENLCLGHYYSAAFKLDIKHLMFSFARYKFISKLFRFEDAYSILELGCSEGIGALFFTQFENCASYYGVDFDESAIQWAASNLSGKNIKFTCGDFLNQMFGSFNVVISIDVIEHINQLQEGDYMDTVCNNLSDHGMAVIGTPNIAMDAYASPASKLAHVNLFSQERLYALCKERFHHVFIFNMNDEIVHTGMDQMSCYIFALCCGKY